MFTFLVLPVHADFINILLEVCGPDNILPHHDTVLPCSDLHILYMCIHAEAAGNISLS